MAKKFCQEYFVDIILSVVAVGQLDNAGSAKEVTPVRVHCKEVIILLGKWRSPVRDGVLRQPDP
eukprot:11787510-Karenia_brevis.AAC.1